MKRSRNIVDLLEEMIREILLRLPVKTLLRCKCVCKQWRALIGSPSFIDCHFKHESNRDCLLIQREPFGFHGDRIECSMYTDDGRHFRIDMPSGIQSCGLLGHANGMFCAMDPLLGCVVLFNPATRKFKPLPPIPLRERESVEFGFGFDPYSGDYKVVVFEAEVESQNFFTVYNSSSDSWREKTEIMGSLNGRVNTIDWGCRRHEVILNGVYHWFMEFTSILGFDMKSENFHEIPLSDAIIREIESDEINIDMTAYGDSLALVSSYVYVDGRFDLWVMGSDGLWSKSFSFALPLPKMWALCVWKKNELWLEKTIVEGEEPESERKSFALFECDISTLEVRKVEPEFDNSDVCRILSYKESLFSLEGERDMPDFDESIFQLCDYSGDDSMDGEIDFFELADEGEIDIHAYFPDIFGPGPGPGDA